MKLNFTIADQTTTFQTHQIMGLCEYLTTRVLEPMFIRTGWKWNRRFMNFFTFDNTCDPLDPTGTICFSIPPLFAGQVGELENAIQQELSGLSIETGPFAYERHPATGAVQQIFIPVIHNPTAQLVPPEVNISKTRGCLVLRDLLGYQHVNGRYEFAADDLLKRVSLVTEDKIAACTASPVWDPKSPQSLKPTPSPVSMKAIMRCLSEIKQFAQWALSHNYRRLAAI